MLRIRILEFELVLERVRVRGRGRVRVRERGLRLGRDDVVVADVVANGGCEDQSSRRARHLPRHSN